MAPRDVIQAAEKSQQQKKRKRVQQEEEGLDGGAAASSSRKSEAQGDAFKQKTLMLSSRGVTHRMRHVMNDLSLLLPNIKKESKLDTKHQLYMVNELADLSNCNNAIFFEARRHADLYMWLSKAPNGPSLKCHVLNSHTMDELKMTGNCLKGSRPVVVFDSAFEADPHWRLIKELLTHIFAVPKSSRRAKPFVDHVTSFSIADNKIWFRNYQIIEGQDSSEADLAAATAAANSASKTPTGTKAQNQQISLNEIGPRFVLSPIKIFEGSFCGAVLYENDEFVSPAAASAQRKALKANKYRGRKAQQDEREEKLIQLEANRVEDPLESRKVFA